MLSLDAKYSLLIGSLQMRLVQGNSERGKSKTSSTLKSAGISHPVLFAINVTAAASVIGDGSMNAVKYCCLHKNDGAS